MLRVAGWLWKTLAILGCAAYQYLVHWTTIAGDWGAAASNAVAARIERGLVPGAIICLHDGRELAQSPDISTTIASLERTLPRMRDRGFELVTVTGLLAQSFSQRGELS